MPSKAARTVALSSAERLARVDNSFSSFNSSSDFCAGVACGNGWMRGRGARVGLLELLLCANAVGILNNKAAIKTVMRASFMVYIPFPQVQPETASLNGQ